MELREQLPRQVQRLHHRRAELLHLVQRLLGRDRAGRHLALPGDRDRQLAEHRRDRLREPAAGQPVHAARVQLDDQLGRRQLRRLHPAGRAHRPGAVRRRRRALPGLVDHRRERLEGQLLARRRGLPGPVGLAAVLRQRRVRSPRIQRLSDLERPRRDPRRHLPQLRRRTDQLHPRRQPQPRELRGRLHQRRRQQQVAAVPAPLHRARPVVQQPEHPGADPAPGLRPAGRRPDERERRVHRRPHAVSVH